MTEVLDFKSWQLKPGNYRLLKEVQVKIKLILPDFYPARTWSDLYDAFEKSVEKSYSNRDLFDTIFDTCPPKAEKGATERQLRIYRGATPKPDLIQEPSTGQYTVTYRGKEVEKVRDDIIESSDSKNASPRYYRGVRIK